MGHDEDTLRQRFDEAASGGGGLALLVIDLDHLSSVSDFWGAAVAGAILTAFADRVAGVLPLEEAPVDRGDGRLFVLRRLATSHEARALAQRLRSHIADRPFEVPGGQDAVFMTASIGIAVFPAAGIDRFEKLAAAAIAAVEEAKRAGGNRALLAPPAVSS